VSDHINHKRPHGVSTRTGQGKIEFQTESGEVMESIDVSRHTFDDILKLMQDKGFDV